MSTISCPLCGADSTDLVWSEGGYDLVRCNACSLMFVGNPPDAEELSRIYSFESGYHRQLADDSDRASDLARENARHHLDLIEQVQGPGHILDVGCASGSFMREAKDRGWIVSGVELNGDTADVARQHGLSVTTGTISAIHADERFDAVTMWDLLEHVPNPLDVLREARKLLSPGGCLWVATPNVDGLFPSMSLRVADWVGVWPHPEPPHHLCQFSEKTLRQALARAGFTRVDVTHERIPFGFTFGSGKQLLTEPKRLAYTAVFAPLVILGPAVSRGDSIVACSQV